MLDKTSGQVLALSGSGQSLLEISLDRLIKLLLNLSRKVMYIRRIFHSTEYNTSLIYAMPCFSER